MYGWSSKNQANIFMNVQLANRYVIQEEKGISVLKNGQIPWSDKVYVYFADHEIKCIEVRLEEG